MGVTKLFTYLKTNCKDCVEFVDLVQTAKDRNGIKILVDFYSWEHYIQAKFLSSLDCKTENPYLKLCGGEYKSIRDYMTSYVEALRGVNIELLFFLDGAKGSSDVGTDRKWSTWLERQRKDAGLVRKTLRILKGEMPMKHFDSRNMTRPCLQEVQNITTVLNLGCKIKTVLSGEADTFIAKHMLEDESAVAVFTNDTDFCIFPHCVFLSDCYFDVRNDLKMVTPSLKVKKPSRLICGLIKSDRLWRHFGFTGAASLCELAILAGNDFTLPILNRINAYGSHVGQISKVVEVIRQYGTVENFPMFLHFMMSQPELERAVCHSRNFYSLSLPLDKDEQTDNLTQSIISRAIQDIRYPGTIFAMYKRFYWHRMILEDTEESYDTAERSMVYLRAHLYYILLPHDQETVTEYGRTPNNDFEEMMAHKVKMPYLPSLPVIQKNSFSRNRAAFHNIMSHQEYTVPDITKGYFHLYGNKLGFTCYILRYFLLMNWQQNLCITKEEFLLICAWLLGCHDPEHYQCVPILPSPRCMTIENWLLCLYRTAHAFIGSVLNLTHEFPTPADLFSGAVWVNLYTSSYLGPKDLKRPSHLFPRVPREHIRYIDKDVKSILNDRRHIIENVIKDVFPLSI